MVTVTNVIFNYNYLVRNKNLLTMTITNRMVYFQILHGFKILKVGR